MLTKSEWERLDDTARELALTMYDRAIAEGMTDPVVLDAALVMQSTATILNRHQRKARFMQGYTFRCVNDDCAKHSKPISGVTMVDVIDGGTPICENCGDDLALDAPDDEITTRDHHIRHNEPTAYSPIPGPPVNPRDAQPTS